MAPTHKVAVIQWHIKDLAPEENHAKACDYIRQAAAQGAKLAVLPEYHLVGWVPEDPLYVTLANDYLKYLKSYQSLAKELNICIVPGTLVERHVSVSDNGTETARLYNTAHFIGNDGEILGSYRKKNIWIPEREYLSSSAHDPHEVIDTPIGKVGMLICWDLAFPEAFRELIAKGADVIIIPTYWTKYDALPEALALNPETEVLFIDSTLTARTFENTCAIIFANAAGPANKFMGTSRVSLPFVGAVGKMGSEEGVSVVDMDLGILDLAESCYKVREDINSEGWHYEYRHNSTAGS